MKLSTAAQVLVLLISFPRVPLHGQSQTRPQTFEGMITIPRDRTAQPKASLEGVVLSETGEPLPGATIQLSRSITALELLLDEGVSVTPVAPATTNAEGRFSFPELEAASYTLAASKEGYVSRELAPTAGRGSVVLRPGQSIANVEVRLTRSGRVTGVVRSPAGAPAAGISVQLLPPNDQFARPVVARTAEDGSYQIDGFAPGEHILVAGSPLTLNGEPARSFARSLFIQNSDPMTVDFPLAGTARNSIRGQVRDSRSGLPPDTVSWTLKVQSPTAGRALVVEDVSRIAYNPKTGTFEIPNLYPGIYWVGAKSGDNTALTCSPPQAVIADSDVTGLELILFDCL